MARTRYLLGLGLLLLTFPQPGFTQAIGGFTQPNGEGAITGGVIEVTDADSYDVRKLELGRGQTADIIVYLSSLGDLVEKYLVILRRATDNKRVRTLLSDKHGRVKFADIPPGEYRIYVSRRVKEDGDMSTVKIGDVRLYVSPPKFVR
ncbi:MAG: hypothetical protein KDD69_17055 [Bdellovibrionales bacterium]|nr:hypothetical protein [Bdellovibrionales bacterium]